MIGKGRKTTKKRVVVIGLGSFGSWISRALVEQGHDVIAVDKKQEVVDQHAHTVTRGVVGDGTDREFLEKVGAGGADAAVISTGGDLAASVLATLALRDLGLENIIVKVTSGAARRVLEALHVRETIFPEKEAAVRLAHRLTSTTILEYVPLGEDHSIQEIAIPDQWIGKTLKELALPRKHGIQVIAIQDQLMGRLNVVPDPEQPLRESDVAVVVGENRSLSRALQGSGEG